MMMIMIYLLTAVGWPCDSSCAVQIYTQTIHRTTQNKQYIEQHNNLEENGPCPIFAGLFLFNSLAEKLFLGIKKDWSGTCLHVHPSHMLVSIVFLTFQFSLILRNKAVPLTDPIHCTR